MKGDILITKKGQGDINKDAYRAIAKGLMDSLGRENCKKIIERKNKFLLKEIDSETSTNI